MLVDNPEYKNWELATQGDRDLYFILIEPLKEVFADIRSRIDLITDDQRKRDALGKLLSHDEERFFSLLRENFQLHCTRMGNPEPRRWIEAS